MGGFLKHCLPLQKTIKNSMSKILPAVMLGILFAFACKGKPAGTENNNPDQDTLRGDTTSISYQTI